jgi:hypothetical protein
MMVGQFITGPRPVLSTNCSVANLWWSQDESTLGHPPLLPMPASRYIMIDEDLRIPAANSRAEREPGIGRRGSWSCGQRTEARSRHSGTSRNYRLRGRSAQAIPGRPSGPSAHR